MGSEMCIRDSFGSAPTADDSEGLIVPVTRGGESGHSLLFNFETPDHRKG